MHSNKLNGQWGYIIALLFALILLAACTDPNHESVSNDEPQPNVSGSSKEGVVTGRVTDMAGNPIENAVVAPSGNAPIPEIAVRTNENGEYSWALPPGTFTITIHKDQYASVSQELELKTGEEVRLDFTIKPAE